MLEQLANIVAGFGESSGDITLSLPLADWINKNLTGVSVLPITDSPDCKSFLVSLPKLRAALTSSNKPSEVVPENSNKQEGTPPANTSEETNQLPPVQEPVAKNKKK